MRLAKHPALRQRRTSNGPDAVTVRIQPAFGLDVNCNESRVTVHARYETKRDDTERSLIMQRVKCMKVTVLGGIIVE